MNSNESFVKQLLSEGIPFKVRNISHVSKYVQQPFRMDGGAILLCTEGDATFVINTRIFKVKKGCEAILWDDTLFIKESSENFRMTMLLYSKEIIFQATRKFDSSFFNHIIQNPIFQHTEGSEEMLMHYMRILQEMQTDTHNRYCVVIASNLVRSIMLNIYDKIQRFGNGRGNLPGSRKEEIYSRFMDLIIEHVRKHRDVNFYADRLCISTKYLADVTKAVAQETPKQSIDGFIVSEIKLMLTFSEMTIQQIADYLHFPDQSYLGRFFKHHTGLSPSQYRQEQIVM